MGEVYLARVGEIEGFQKPCVIKKVLPQLAADKEFTSRFVAEARIAIKLQHANIAPVYEVGLADDDYFLALELVDGRDLGRTAARARAEERRIPVEVGLYVIREVASGLAYAHRRTDDDGRPLGLVHCDISPPNVLLGFEGEVKLIDFGIARSAAHLAAELNLGFGKIGYMAPEQLGSFGGLVDRRADIYATGVLLYQLLTGNRPFDLKSDQPASEMARQILRGAPRVSDRAPGLGTRFDNLVARALAPDPSNRYGSAEELRDAVQRQLVEIAPTFSGERFGGYLRELFSDEVGQTAELADADMTVYQEELRETRSHTISFALSEAWTSPLGPLTGAVALPLPPPARRPAAAYVAPAGAAATEPWGAARTKGRGRPRKVLIAAALVPVVAAAALLGWRISRSGAGTPQDVLAFATPAEVPPRAPPVAASSPAPPAAATPRSGKKTTKKKPVPPPPLTREVVAAHYDKLKRKYREYELSNGKQLADQWDKLTSYYAFRSHDLAGFSREMISFERFLDRASRSK